MLVNRSMPQSTVIPVVGYDDVLAASAWLCEAFGFVERVRIGTHRVQLAVGDGAIVLGDGGAPDGRAESHSVMVRVEDVNRHHGRALAHGARIVQEPTDHPFGERQYTAQDLAGHTWTFSQSVADVAPEDWGGTTVAPA